MDRTEKEQVVKEVKKTIGDAQVGLATHYRGLTVAEMTDLRNKLHTAGVDFRVVKNTLARLAIKGSPFEPLSEHLKGPTALAFAKDPAAPAKVLTDFAKTAPNLVVLGGVLDGKSIDNAGIKALADLPSREVLLAQLLGTMNGPIQGIVNVLSAVPGSLVRVLDQVRQQKEQAEAA